MNWKEVLPTMATFHIVFYSMPSVSRFQLHHSKLLIFFLHDVSNSGKNCPFLISITNCRHAIRTNCRFTLHPLHRSHYFITFPLFILSLISLSLIISFLKSSFPLHNRLFSPVSICPFLFISLQHATHPLQFNLFA